MNPEHNNTLSKPFFSGSSNDLTHSIDFSEDFISINKKENSVLFDDSPENIFIQENLNKTSDSVKTYITKSISKSDRLKSLRKLAHRRAFQNIEQSLKFPNPDLCPICLGEINEIEGYLSCSHRFCFVCIKNWSQYTNSCPLCKNDFLSIIKKKNGENGIERIIIEPKRLEFEEEQTENELSDTDDVCEICEKNDNNFLLLICDRCNFFVCHTYCMNPPLDIIPQNEWYCSQCAKIMPNLKYNNFNNTNNSEKKIQSRDNLRKRVKHSIAIFNEVRIPTRSFYTDKKFEYKELDDEILLHELKNESLLNKYIFGNNEKTKHIKNKIRTRSNKFNDEESEKEKAELASKIRNNTIKTKNLVKKMIRKNK